MPANQASGIFVKLDYALLHRQTIEQQKMPGEGSTCSQQEFECFRRLDAANDACQRRKYTCYRAALALIIPFRRKQALVA